MRFKAGTAIFSADGTHVGSLKSVVMTPRSQEITNLVVSQGFLKGEDKVVPLNWVGHTNSNGDIVLLHSRNDFEGLPAFEEVQYVRTDDWRDDTGLETTDSMVSAERRAMGDRTVDQGGSDDRVPEADALEAAALTPAYFYTGAPGYMPINPAFAMGAIPPTVDSPRYVSETVKNIPSGTVALPIGAAVLTRRANASLDDTMERAGSVDEVFTDTHGNVTHFVISKGLLFTTRKLIPTDWIETVSEDGVQLSVAKDVIDRLPDYDSQQRSERR